MSVKTKLTKNFFRFLLAGSRLRRGVFVALALVTLLSSSLNIAAVANTATPKLRKHRFFARIVATLVFSTLVFSLSTFNIGLAQPLPPPPEICSELDAGSFCGQQVIRNAVLSFSSIPESFSFPTVTSGREQTVYNNGPLPTYEPGPDDLLGVLDTRESGGFEVQLQEASAITDGTPPDIPPENAGVATSILSSYVIPGITNQETAVPCIGTSAPLNPPDCGVIYGDSVETRGIIPAADSKDGSLGSTATYTSHFGGGPIVLMSAGLPTSSGRNGSIYQFVNYSLTIPPRQHAGDYAFVITFDLLDTITNAEEAPEL